MGQMRSCLAIVCETLFLSGFCFFFKVFGFLYIFLVLSVKTKNTLIKPKTKTNVCHTTGQMHHTTSLKTTTLRKHLKKARGDVPTCWHNIYIPGGRCLSPTILPLFVSSRGAAPPGPPAGADGRAGDPFPRAFFWMFGSF